MSWFFIIIGFLFFGALILVLIFLFYAWPQLTLLQVHKLPEVRQSQKKDEILRRRAALRAHKKDYKFNVFNLWWLSFFGRVQTKFRWYVDKLEKTLLDRRRQMISTPLTDEQERDRRHKIKNLLREASEALSTGALDSAEKAFISVISLDTKNAAAYNGLGDVYFDEHQFNEARETYRYAFFLNKNNDHALTRLAEISETEGNLSAALEYYQQAVLLNDGLSQRFFKLYELLNQLGQPQTAVAAIAEALSLEPQNPKYLDNYIEASILVGDKLAAEEGYKRLALVNPENQKLPAFLDRINAIF